MATVNEKMTALADEIRTLSGTTDAMGLDVMTTKVEEANSEVDGQTELLAQIATALEGKIAGGSGGTSVETCTVTIINNIGGSTCFVVATQFIDGFVTSYYLEEHYASGSPLTIENVLCNSVIAFYANDAIIPAYSIDGTALYYAKQKNYWAFSTPSVPGESCTITLWDDD